MCEKLWRYLLMDLSIVLPRKSCINVSFGVQAKSSMATGGVKWSIQQKTPWKDAFGDVELKPWLISAQGEEKRVTASQSHRKMPQETSGTWVGPGRDKLVNRVSVWPEVQGFCSDHQELEVWTWSEAERSKIHLVCNYMPVQGIWNPPALAVDTQSQFCPMEVPLWDMNVQK